MDVCGLAGWRSRLTAWRRRAAATAAAGIAVLSLGIAVLSLGVTALSLGLAPAAIAAPWPASGRPHADVVGVNGEFGLAPAPGPHGRLMSYFRLAVTPGHAVTATIIVADLARHPQTLALGHAVGVTAGNGGDAYLPAGRRCQGPACWVTGLPSRITLAAGSREAVSFTVRVPRQAPPGQYLTGITATPATVPAPVKLGSDGRSATQAVIIDTVTMAVAITVGAPSSLVSRLSIHGVRGTTEGPVARLNTSLYNTGQTFSGGPGRASCQAGGQWHSYSLYANTVLPGGHALIGVNAPGLPEGTTVPCVIQVRYGKRQVVTWSGSVAIPTGPAGRAAGTGKGGLALATFQGLLARWGFALAAICLLLAAAAWAFTGKRRPRRH